MFFKIQHLPSTAPGLTRNPQLFYIPPLKSAPMARYMRDKVAGVTVPNYYVDRIAKAQDPKAEGINICVEQIQQLKQIEGVAGVHIMAIEWEAKVLEIVEKAKLKRN